MARITIELPCNIGDTLYEIVIDNIGKEVCLDQYIIQDVSIKAIKYCDKWVDRSEMGTLIFLDLVDAKSVFEKMRITNEFGKYNFFYFDQRL